MAITNDFILRGGLKASDQGVRDMYAQRAAQEAAQTENDAKIAQLIKGGDIKKDQLANSTAVAEDAAQRQGFGPGQASISATDAGYHIAPIDNLDKSLKRAQLQNATDDREDRIQGREANALQNYYSHEGGKDYGARARTLQNAIGSLQKGDPESQRIAQLELAQAVARGTLTQNEMDAVVGSHGAGNRMQQQTKDMSVMSRNLLPKVVGDPIGNWLSKKADDMDIMTPDEIKSKVGLLQNLYDSNKLASDRIQEELRTRAPQLAPNTSRRNPKGLANTINSLGARIPQDPDMSMHGQGSDKAPPSLDPAKPRTVQQNGHTYTLNPKTGQYE